MVANPDNRFSRDVAHIELTFDWSPMTVPGIDGSVFINAYNICFLILRLVLCLFNEPLN